MKNIISTQNDGEHSVQQYRFKILGGPVVEVSEQEKIAVEEESLKQEYAKKQEKQAKEDINQGFIEELLKKSDELSSNIIKLQMQIEKQDVEFEKRLTNELAKESLSSFEKGYQKAKEELQEGQDMLKNKYSTSIGTLETTIQKIEERLVHIEDDLSQTAIEIAKEVIAKEVSSQSAKIAHELSKELIAQLRDARTIEIKVNPQDYEYLKQAHSQSEFVHVMSDDAIAKGGVVVFSEAGNLDGNLSTRLQKVKNLIQNG
ncbi:MAG: flagellar assembly protein FliH [Sulfurospirillum sp.]|nr:flagellar assembly protein FliH [Sulfurospirillum sp.]